VPQAWLQLSIRTAKPHLEIFSNYVIEKGSPGVVLKNGGLDAYFPSSRRDAALKTEVNRFVGARAGKARLEWRVVQPEDWENSWKRFIKPARVGRSFWVTPPWLNRPNFRRREIITIEPGMAFGTGTHATTRSCMEFLEVVADKIKAKKWSVLDVGTGSGILAIASQFLGATEIWAIDNDPIAIRVARENLRLNGIGDAVVLSGRKISTIRRSFTVVIGNLTAETIIELAKILQSRVAAHGYLILSGILHWQAQNLLRCFAEQFTVVKRQRKREWASFLLQRKF
jgi:ribosomal protein L11 methyltransferase